MTSKSKIEWTEATWNPVTGCTKVSPGCKNCYAETMANRLKAMGARGYENGFDLSILPERLVQPLKQKTPVTYFVNSMSDLFQDEVPTSYIDEVISVMRKSPQHTFQVLTKRAERMRAYFSKRACPENMWIGVSVEDRKYGVPRIDELRQINASIRFLSAEPLLESLGKLDLEGIHWVIVGGESGSRARAMSPDWVKEIKMQCDDQGSAFFFKQWGGWGADGVKRNKKANGRQFEGRTWDSKPTIEKALSSVY